MQPNLTSGLARRHRTLTVAKECVVSEGRARVSARRRDIHVDHQEVAVGLRGSRPRPDRGWAAHRGEGGEDSQRDAPPPAASTPCAPQRCALPSPAALSWRIGRHVYFPRRGPRLVEATPDPGEVQARTGLAEVSASAGREARTRGARGAGLRRALAKARRRPSLVRQPAGSRASALLR